MAVPDVAPVLTAAGTLVAAIAALVSAVATLRNSRKLETVKQQTDGNLRLVSEHLQRARLELVDLREAVAERNAAEAAQERTGSVDEVQRQRRQRE